MNIDWLEHDSIVQDEPLFDLSYLKEKYEVHSISESGYIIINDQKDDFVKFAVMSFYMSDLDDSNIKVSLVFHGEGPSGALRELRHTWWGDNGYVFYPNADIICNSLQFLKKYFDI